MGATSESARKAWATRKQKAKGQQPTSKKQIANNVKQVVGVKKRGRPKSQPAAPLEKEIRAKCNQLAEFLIEKNRAYGNSAANPSRIFAKDVSPLAQIDIRIDDKLNRLMKGSEYPGDDTIWDLAGYMVLRMIVKDQS